MKVLWCIPTEHNSRVKFTGQIHLSRLSFEVRQTCCSKRVQKCIHKPEATDTWEELLLKAFILIATLKHWLYICVSHGSGLFILKISTKALAIPSPCLKSFKDSPSTGELHHLLQELRLNDGAFSGTSLSLWPSLTTTVPRRKKTK